jgi:hypothetical protein
MRASLRLDRHEMATTPHSLIQRTAALLCLKLPVTAAQRELMKPDATIPTAKDVKMPRRPSLIIATFLLLLQLPLQAFACHTPPPDTGDAIALIKSRIRLNRRTMTSHVKVALQNVTAEERIHGPIRVVLAGVTNPRGDHRQRRRPHRGGTTLFRILFGWRDPGSRRKNKCQKMEVFEPATKTISLQGP